MAEWVAAHLYIFVLWLVAMNLIAFVLMGVDKRRAKKGMWRVPERTLFLPALLGGGLCALLGMKVFHHKTIKPLFRYGMPVVCVLNIVVCAALFAWAL